MPPSPRVFSTHAQCKPLERSSPLPRPCPNLVKQPLHPDPSKGTLHQQVADFLKLTTNTAAPKSPTFMWRIQEDFFGLLFDLLDFGSSSILHLGRFYSIITWASKTWSSFYIECYHHQFPFSSSCLCTLVSQGQSWLVLSLPTPRWGPEVDGMEAEPWAPQPLSPGFSVD